MTSSQRIVINTLATYGRSVFAMALGLFSSRWVLQALGEVDYGLMGVVGAVIVFITFLNGVSSGACTRFFAYSIGKGDPEEMNRWFNTALSIHTILPAVLIVVGYPIGVWLIHHFFNIPSERLNTALWVFRFSLVSAFTGMCFTPYMGMFTAKQRIYEMSVWGILQSLCMFTLAYVLTLYKGDCWLLYSGGMVGIMVLLGFCQVLRARHLFSECRIHFSKWWDRQKLTQLFSFVGWQLFGAAGWLFRNNGAAILLNKYFSPSIFPNVNAAYGIGVNVSSQTQALAGAMLGAFMPEITASEGRGNRTLMLIQVNRASKLGALLVLVFAIPLMLEIDYVLVLWLKKPPELARIFCVLILAQFLIDKLTIGLGVAVNAVGRIAFFQVVLCSSLILTISIAWLLLALGFGAVSIGWSFILTMTLVAFTRIFFAKYITGLSPLIWGREVLLPCVIVAFTGIGTGLGIQVCFNDASFVRLVAVGGGAFVSMMVLGWFIVLNMAERQFVLRHLKYRFR